MVVRFTPRARVALTIRRTLHTLPIVKLARKEEPHHPDWSSTSGACPSAEGAHVLGPGDLAVAALVRFPDAVVSVNEQGLVVFANDAFRALFGETDDIGQHVSEATANCPVLLTDGTLAPRDRWPLVRAALGRERVIEERCGVQRPDGTVIDVVATAIPIEGRGCAAVLFMRDVRRQVELQREATLAARRFEALTLATAQTIWSTSATGEVVVDSPSWRAFTGQTFKQFAGFGWLEALHPDDRERVSAVWRNAVAQRRLYEIEYRVRRHDGVYRWMMARGTPLLDERGVVREWIGCNWDIHPIKSAQEEYARLSELRRLLMAVVGHDLRSPMTAILMASAVLARPENSSGVRRLAARIRRGADRASNIIDLLVDLTQTSLLLNRTESDLANVCRDILSEFEGQAPGRAVSFEHVGDTRGRFDQARIGQVVANLVGNAIHHGTPGTPVAVRVIGFDHTVRLEIDNQAPPIPAERLAGIFDPFKGPRDGADARGHLGLGLYIVQRVVAAHGGTVSVTSDASRTRFVVTLPRERDETVTQVPVT
jgi:PAS domain S-box-containing protein